MSKVKIQGHASGTGILTVTAPNTSTDRTITLPDEDVTLGAATPSIDDNGNATAITIDSSENVIIGASSFDQGSFSGSATGINVHGVSPLVLCKETDTNIRGYVGVAGGDMYVMTPDSANLYIGTNDAARMIIDSSGRITAPAQPAFQAKPASEQSNIAINTAVTVVLGTEIFDQGSNFASNTFTAPVTGKYQLNVTLRLNNVDSAAGYYHVYLKTSNRDYFALLDPDYGQDAAFLTMHVSVLADMDANDTTHVQIYQQSGTAQTDINSGDTVFSGYLVA